MNVLVRSKRSNSSVPRSRRGHAAGPYPPRLDVLTVPPPAALRRRRELSAPQDQALYTCQCGFVFEAQVSTSVGCPHCGDTQAW